jgi:putative hydrolase of the HAD superfamily
MTNLTAIGFDADDTLWQNEQFFQLSKESFTALLADHGDTHRVSSRLLEAERRNLKLYGFGAKGFTLSMIETALEVTDGTVPQSVIGKILALGRAMLDYPIETLPHVHDTLEALAGKYRIILITKGDLFDQERKLAQSGLGDFFDAVEIVSDKTPAIYERVFARHADGAARAMMIGNSMKSDVIPALEAGAWGVHVPHALMWELDHAQAPDGHPRFLTVANLGEIPELIGNLSQKAA